MTQQEQARGQCTSPTARDGAAEVVMARRLTSDLRVALPRVYLVDIGVSAAGGWTAFGVAVWPAWPLGVRFAAAAFAVLLLYRALLFIHELFHQPALRGVRRMWHTVAGVPLLLPLLLYLPVHQRHHSADSYGTIADGEYEQFDGRCVRMAARLLLLNAALPFAMVVRFAVLGPLGWFVPVIRREVLPSLVHLSMRMRFRAAPLRGAAATEAARIEIACAAWSWLLLAGLCTSAAPAVLAWAGLLVGIATLNTLRALCSTHLYVERAAGRNALEQVDDSLNIAGGGALTWLLCPVGLRYHALHHLAPYVPYHAMPEAHRRLMEWLPDDAHYRRASVANPWQGWLRLFRATQVRSLPRPSHVRAG